MDASGSSASSFSDGPSPAPVAPAREPTAPDSPQPPVLDAFGNPLELPAHISPHRVFELLDQVLPFEICLYHRVLPLSEAGNQIQLGMVDPYDEQALDYVRRIVAYRDRTLAPVVLAGHVHQVLLSAYLNYASQRSAKQSTESVSERPAEGELSDGQLSGDGDAERQVLGDRAVSPPISNELINELAHDLPHDAGAKTVLQAISYENTQPETLQDNEDELDKAELPPSTPQTLEEWELETLFPTETAVRELQELGIPSPEDSTKSRNSTLDIEHLTYLETQPASIAKATPAEKAEPDEKAGLSEKAHASEKAIPAAPPLEPAMAIDQRLTLILDETEILAQLTPVQTASAGAPPTLIEGEGFERLSQPVEASESVELPLRQDLVEEVPGVSDRPTLPLTLDALPNGELSQRDWPGTVRLPPDLLLQAMLGRMLRGNITRLRLERCRRPQNQSDLAQLFWNPAGVLQPTWNGFSLGAFGALAKALRELAQLPLGPIQQPIQRGVMRRYQDKPILLLMQFLPGAKTAAIELRLLQNQALQAFQRRQGKDLRRETLLTAQQLQYQVQQLLDHHQRYPETGAVPEQLVAVVKQINQSIANAT